MHIGDAGSLASAPLHVSHYAAQHRDNYVDFPQLTHDMQKGCAGQSRLGCCYCCSGGSGSDDDDDDDDDTHAHAPAAPNVSLLNWTCVESVRRDYASETSPIGRATKSTR